jgi:hypothetical protein
LDILVVVVVVVDVEIGEVNGEEGQYCWRTRNAPPKANYSTTEIARQIPHDSHIRDLSVAMMQYEKATEKIQKQ